MKVSRISDKTISLVGPFTDEDLRKIWQTIKQIEALAPQNRYKMIIDDPNDKNKPSQEILDKMNEIADVSEGYARVQGYARLQKKETQ